MVSNEIIQVDEHSIREYNVGGLGGPGQISKGGLDTSHDRRDSVHETQCQESWTECFY